jgi:hypothetical protein
MKMESTNGGIVAMHRNVPITLFKLLLTASFDGIVLLLLENNAFSNPIGRSKLPAMGTLPPLLLPALKPDADKDVMGVLMGEDSKSSSQIFTATSVAPDPLLQLDV